MIVVSDTGPINYLVLIGEIQVLRELYADVLLPPTVRDELLDPASPDVVRQWAADPPLWVRVICPRSGLSPDAFQAIDEGEREALALAVEAHADLVLIDDARGRKAAKSLSLQCTGTLGVLQAAAAKGLLDLGETVQNLRKTSFFVSERLLQRLLSQEI
jgi:predicted nucleic acid-binding protein